MGTTIIAPYSKSYFEKYSNDSSVWTQVSPRVGTKQVVLQPLNAAHTLKVTTTVVHDVADATNTVTAGDATDTSSLYALANELKTDLNAHFIATTWHKAADSVNEIESANATTEGTAVTLVNELYLDLLAHLIETGVHYSNDLTEISGTLSTDESSAITLVNIVKAGYVGHIGRTAEAYETTVAGYSFVWNCNNALWVQLSSSGDLSVRTHT